MRKSILLLLLVAAGCRTSKLVSQSTVTHRDSVTTITERPVAIHVPADSLVDAVALLDFTQVFHAAAVGSVVRSATSASGKLKYHVRKTSAQDFAVEIDAQARDTVVTVADTHTTVTEKTTTTQVRETQPTRFAKVVATLKNSLFWLLALGAVLVGVRAWWVTQ